MTTPPADKTGLMPPDYVLAGLVEEYLDHHNIHVYEDRMKKAFGHYKVQEWLASLIRPTPQSAPGDDVVEAMARAHRNHGEKGMPYGNPYTDKGLLEKMQAALAAAEAMGYVLAKQDRVPFVAEDIDQSEVNLLPGKIIHVPDNSWKTMDSAPRDKRIIACIWHGIEYQVVIAKWSAHHNGWLDVNSDSCVAYIVDGERSKLHEAYWRPLPAPPAREKGE